MPRAYKAWRERRRLRRFERLGIPDDVRERMEKAGVCQAPDWYAGRSTKGNRNA
jgi:hypothetical protein